jgi:hypothetical protein
LYKLSALALAVATQPWTHSFHPGPGVQLLLMQFSSPLQLPAPVSAMQAASADWHAPPFAQVTHFPQLLPGFCSHVIPVELDELVVLLDELPVDELELAAVLLDELPVDELELAAVLLDEAAVLLDELPVDELLVAGLPLDELVVAGPPVDELVVGPPVDDALVLVASVWVPPAPEPPAPPGSSPPVAKGQATARQAANRSPSGRRRRMFPIFGEKVGRCHALRWSGRTVASRPAPARARTPAEANAMGAPRCA